MEALLPFVIIAALLYVFIVVPIKRRRQASESSSQLEAKLARLRSSIVVVAGSTIPGKEIKNVLGIVTGISSTQATTKEQFDLAEKEAMLALIEKAQGLGANAIIDLKLNTGSYQQDGSKWQVSQTIYNGTAVVVAQV